MSTETIVATLDKEIESEYDTDITMLYEQYQSESPDYFSISQEI